MGKFIPFAVLAFDFAMDFYDGKTIGQATTHIATTAVASYGIATGIGAGIMFFGAATPVGWVAIGIGVVDSVGEAISGTYNDIKSCFGW